MRPFLLERYYARHEFSVPHMLSSSDCESMTVAELLQLTGTPRSRLDDLRLGYTESQGAPALRHAIAGMYGGIGADDVLTTAAPEEGILLVMTSLLQPGQRAVVLGPCYQSLMELARWRGCTVDIWELQGRDDGWALDLDALDALLSRPADLLVVNFPHNPTGFLPSRETFEAVLSRAAERGVPVFSDEMYRGLEPPGARLPSAAELQEDAVALCGLSKSFGLPGLRVGWLVSRDRGRLQALSTMKDYTTICSSAPSEVLAEAAVGSWEALAERSRRRIVANLARIAPFMERWSSVFRWHPPRAGAVGLAGVPGRSAEAVCAVAREEGGVLLVPSTVFSFGDGHVRLGLGREGLESALAALEPVLERLPAL